AHDYRYFPEPDLAPLEVDPAWLESLRRSLPEIPLARRDRFIDRYGLSAYDAEVLTADRGLADFYEACVKAGVEAKAASNLIMGEMLRILKERNAVVGDCKASPEAIAELLALSVAGTISAATAKGVFEEMFLTGKAPGAIVSAKGLTQISDQSELERIAGDVVKNNPKSVEDYRAGREKAIGFLMGQVMKATKGKANPKVVQQLLEEKLRNG
ncbi:MAG: Asp-tRNA(Asn)/Glu-tRNA(Gln) amidotransferase GatCAB subunit B, partial [Candidatus Aureabacteria bacterium]|nr:Asp-tRNA(Asn)/Glu-tRNA(Gln) amidotransferase GatCAB subunit B [Candidatus Auribacterota bacterium]